MGAVRDGRLAGLFRTRSDRTRLALTVGILWLVFIVLVHAARLDPWTVVLLDVASAVLAIAATVWPLWGGIGLLACLLGYLLVPLEWVTVGEYSGIVGVLGVSLRHPPSVRLVFASVYFCVAVVLTAREVRDLVSLVGYIAFWAMIILMALTVGTSFQAYAASQARERRLLILNERHEIARELHDTVAHALSLVVMRAEEARIRGQATSEDLDFITTTSADSIQDLRAMLHLLRDDSGPQTSVPAMRWVVPDLNQAIASASARLEANGFAPSIVVDGNLDGLPAKTAETAARVVEETSTNMIKHGDPRGTCVMMVSAGDVELEMAFVNDVRRTLLSGFPRYRQLGLVGMQERVTTLGGTLESGVSGTRWITRANLPVPHRADRRANRE